MRVIGLTGGICSGKSSVTQICQSLGGHIINADILGHQAYLQGTECYQDLINQFGTTIVKEDGSINRQALGAIVFSDESKMKQLNQIVWPRIRRMIENELQHLREEGVTQIVVLEAAILIEAGWYDLVDEVWVVDVERAVAIDRLMSRNGLSHEESERRISSQLTSEERRKYANRIIINSGSKEELENVVRSYWTNSE